jgi:hypothetical protein
MQSSKKIKIGQLGVQDALNSKVDKTNWVDISLTSTIVGFASFTTRVIWYKRIDTNLILLKINLSGVSNSGLLNLTIPFTSVNNSTNNITSAGVVNTGVAQAGPGFAVCNPNTNIVNIFRDFNAVNFSTSGIKTGQTTMLIEIQ